jgi:hypothetical protein
MDPKTVSICSLRHDYLSRQCFANRSLHTDKPHEDSNIRGDAFKTLIIARLSYEANEQDLEREFGRFGPIERVCALRLPAH